MSTRLKLLVDVGVGKAVEDWLRAEGYDVVVVRDVDPQMSDTEIIAWAAREQRLILTMDKGFGELVYHSRHPNAGVLLLRLEDARSEEKVAVVREIFTGHAAQLPGHFAVYQNGRIRIRAQRDEDVLR